MRFNPLDNYSMEEIESMLDNFIEIEEFATEGQYIIEISDDFEEVCIDMPTPQQPSSTSDGTNAAFQRS